MMPTGPKLTQEECERFVAAIASGRPDRWANELVDAYRETCLRFAWDQVHTQAKAWPAELTHRVTQGGCVEDLATDALVSFLQKCLRGSFECRGAQISSVLWIIVRSELYKLIGYDEGLSDGRTKRRPGLFDQIQNEVSGLPVDWFALGEQQDAGGWSLEDRLAPEADHQPPERESDYETSAPDSDQAAQDDAVLAEDSDTPHASRQQAGHEPPRKSDPTLAELIREDNVARLQRCLEQLPEREQRILLSEVHGAPQLEIARDLGVSPTRINQLKEKGRQSLERCLAAAKLQSEIPALVPVVGVCDETLCLHYVRGLRDETYAVRCRAGIERALQTPRAELAALIDALIADREAKGIHDQIATLDHAHQDERRQRALVLALWGRDRVRYVATQERLWLDAPAGDDPGYLGADQLPLA